LRIENIYIRDFGIFSSQELKKLSGKIVFIGGENRAGKSTFMDIIRHLGYGLPRDASIPPALDEYYIEADLKEADKDLNLSLQGFAEPKIKSEDGEEISAEELYGHLDKFSYQQLFTISLHELNALKEAAGSNKKRRRLYSVLLGAGLSELIRVPQIASSYYSRAKKIGGKRGDPSVAAFKSDYKRIKAAEDKKEKALKQLDRFMENRSRLEKKENQRELLKENIEVLKRDEFLLDILKNSYSDYAELEELEFKLRQKSENDIKEEKFTSQDLARAAEYEEELSELRDEKNKYKNELLKTADEEVLDAFKKALCGEEEVLKKFEQKEEVVIERINNFRKAEEEISSRRQKLKNELKELNSDWESPLQKIKQISTDKLKQSEVSITIEVYRELKKSIKADEEKKDDLSAEYELLKKRAGEFEDCRPGLILKRSYISALFTFVFGAAAAFLDLSFGIYTFAVLILAVYIYYSSNYTEHKAKQKEKEEVNRKEDQLKNQLARLEDNIEDKRGRLRDISAELDKFRSQLKIDAEKGLDLISDYYISLQDKKSRLEIIEIDEKNIAGDKDKIRLDLDELYSSLLKISSSLDEDNTFLHNFHLEKSFIAENYQQLFMELQSFLGYLKIVKSLKKAEFELEELLKEVKTFIEKRTYFEINDKDPLSAENALKMLLSQGEELTKYRELEDKDQNKREKLIYRLKSSDKTSSYLISRFHSAGEEEEAEYSHKFKKDAQAFDEDQQLILSYFFRLYSEYSSAEAAEKAHLNISTELEKAESELEKIEEEINELENKIEALSSSEQIEAAHQELNDARSELRSSAERYAVNKSVYFILKKLRQRIISRAEDELLNPAAEILAEITDNQYTAIRTGDDLEDAEFEAMIDDGEIIQTTDHLSRGTLEQLFLSVRLSRIREIEPPLPIVLDDSLVNFDHSHLYNTAEVISELAERNQIFILSCHPHFAKYMSEITKDVQYWKLEKGEFSLSNAEDIYQHLQRSEQ